MKNLQNADSQTINLNNIKLSQTLLKKLRPSDGIRNNHILAVFTLKKKRYFIFNQSNGIHILRSNPKLMSQHRSILKVFATSKSFHIFGLFKHNGYKAKHKFDNLYLQNNQNSIGKFSRPFKNWKLLNQLVYGKVNYQDIKNMNRIHNNLLCGDENMTAIRNGTKCRQCDVLLINLPAVHCAYSSPHQDAPHQYRKPLTHLRRTCSANCLAARARSHWPP